MVRLWFVVVAMSGCDLAFQIDKIELEPSPCGPYRSVNVVPFVNVSEPRQFSVIGDVAMVTGNDAGDHRPIALRWNGIAWEPDPGRQAGLAALDGANLSPPEPTPDMSHYTGSVQPALLGWSGQPQRVGRYYFNGSQWLPDGLQAPVNDPEYDVRAGNAVIVKSSTFVDDIVRHTIIIKHALDTENSNQILVEANEPPDFNLQARPDRTRPLNDRMLGTGQAVFTDDLRAIVYSTGTSGQADLFASARAPSNDFDMGGFIAGPVNTADDEVEPWVDETCSKLYFRRVPAGRPNDAGQIFVAE